MRIVMTNIVGCLKNPDFIENFWREKLDETKQVTIGLSDTSTRYEHNITHSVFMPKLF